MKGHWAIPVFTSILIVSILALSQPMSLIYAQEITEPEVAEPSTVVKLLSEIIIELIESGDYNVIDNRDGSLGKVLTGTERDDLIIGNPNSSNLILGKGGNDYIMGGELDDYINGGDGNDLIRAGAGFDLIDGGSGDDVIYGDEGVDWIYGRVGDDLLVGGEGDDSMVGGEGDDSMVGGEGDDSMVGGEGDDSMVGGEGDDKIVELMDFDLENDIRIKFDVGDVVKLDLETDGETTGETTDSSSVEERLDVIVERLKVMEAYIRASHDVCDGLDNNLNGQIDEGFVLGNVCTVGIGACQDSGEIVCNEYGTGTVCSVSTLSENSVREICSDGIDNDCDGETDEVVIYDECLKGAGIGHWYCKSYPEYGCYGYRDYLCPALNTGCGEFPTTLTICHGGFDLDIEAKNRHAHIEHGDTMDRCKYNE